MWETGRGMPKLGCVPGKRDIATRRELADPSASTAPDGAGTGTATDTASSVAPELSSVAQDYLKVIWTAQEWSQEKVSTKLLAERIGVSASTVSEAVRKLADQNLVVHARYGAITLTEEGRRAAVAMVRRHRLIETFLVQELGYGWDEVHDEAEVLEHAVSETLMARIDAKLGHPDRDPHGDPIPSADGAVPTPRPGSSAISGPVSPDGSCGSPIPIRPCCATSIRSVSPSIPRSRSWSGEISRAPSRFGWPIAPLTSEVLRPKRFG